jgi:RAD3-like DEAD/DEAH box helicase/helicase-like protein
MFNRGVDELLESLPTLGDLSPDGVRRMLSRAWLEAVDHRDLGGPGPNNGTFTRELRRLATALEVHAILPADVDTETLRACAFVGAEALEISREVSPNTEEDESWLFGSSKQFERVEAGLLYLVAGYDANAGIIGRALSRPMEEPGEGPDISHWTLSLIVDFLLLRPPSRTDLPDPPRDDALLSTQVRHAIWETLGRSVAAHLGWLTFGDDESDSAAEQLRDLASQLESHGDGSPGAAHHSDLHHLVLLVAAACDATGWRALRRVPSPDDDGGRFHDYQRRRARTRPLLWPAAADYAAAALPGPHSHAVVSVPTGAGKSAVAELAVAQAVRDGWVLYLAPTNALVGQIRRQLYEVIGKLQGVEVREFLGGSEYTELAGEALGEIADRQVLAMTPEKCSLALRQNPEVFERLALCIIDEAHTIGARDSRAVIAELVVSEVLHRAPTARVLMMSALLGNPDELQRWLAGATGLDAVVIDRPWRPTRTLRAIAGFDEEQADAAAESAQSELDQLPPYRKNVEFDAPLALLAGLQGAWRSSDSVDYALVRTSITAPLGWHRDKGPVLQGYRNPAVRSLVQALGERGHRVLAFLPRSRHDSFSLARDIAGFSGEEGPVLGDEIEALLRLADAELGAPSMLRDALNKRVAVHTSAMLREEQRASELAFDGEIAWALFATGTLAQGLNLPATAVVIGGTEIGWDKEASEAEKARRARSQLLNAIGRAGRANVAARSMAVVVPNRALAFNPQTNAAETVEEAEFLQEEDASSDVSSQLDGLIAKALDGSLDMTTMSAPEQTAFAFLSFAAGNGDAEGVLSRSWAAQRAGAAPQADEVASALGYLGQQFLSDAQAPEWVALAAHRAGIALPEAAALYLSMRNLLADQPAPRTVSQWSAALIDVLRSLSLPTLQRVLLVQPYKSTALSDIWSEDPEEREQGWNAWRVTLAAWLDGEVLLDVATHAHQRDLEGNAKRGQSDPLPRILRVINDGFGFGLSTAAGALGAIVSAGQEAEGDDPWAIPPDSSRSLALLPLAIRLGASTPLSIAWMRAGARPRVVAHLLSHRVEEPPDLEQLDDDALRAWARAKLDEIAEQVFDPAVTDEERAMLATVAFARSVA